MRISEFDYRLPPERIAQEPAARRDGSRLMVLGRRDGLVRHALFQDLPEWLREGDLLVLNDTRVIPARLSAAKPGGGRAEVFLLERAGSGEGAEQEWRALVRGLPRAPGRELEFPGGLVVGLLGREEGGEVARVRLRARERGADVGRIIARAGKTPLPPYIRRAPEDPRETLDAERYQTVYAREEGAVAAPTAGLHFTRELLDALAGRGVETASLTLHVGFGTFQPVRAERLEDHRMHSERFSIPPGLPDRISAARERGGRVVAVGTTVVRALEGACGEDGRIRAGRGACRLFIRPGHRFQAVDGLITNFHLPRSTLLVLVCAFAGRRRVLDAYREAVESGYRFYSYGDAMVIL